MNRLIMAFAAVMLVVSGIPAAERVKIDDVSSHCPWDGRVDCTYTLSGLENGYIYQGVFTLSVKKDGTTARRAVTNDLEVENGTYTSTFDCVELFGDGVYPNGGIRVDLVREKESPADAVGDSANIMGDVLVIDISGGNSVDAYPVRKYVNVDMGMFNCEAYKTTKVVLRRVPAGTYHCQPGANESTVASQRLVAEKDFYIGVFPVTQRQYELVMGTNPSSFKVDAADNVAALRPVENVSWNMIRGNVLPGMTISDASPDSFLKRLAVKTGLVGFDLPTEAQWEIACRAGSSAVHGARWNGSETEELTSDNIGEMAWNNGNASSITHVVGGRAPNLWGLYDMQGNVWEWCRDVFTASYNVSCVDLPCVDASYLSGENRVLRGGSVYDGVANCRPSARSGDGVDVASGHDGFRLVYTEVLNDASGSPIGVSGDVLVVDVSGGASAPSYPTVEYLNMDMGVFNCEVYKTSKIVMRKVPAGSYYCQPGAIASKTVSQKLTTLKDYYIGVFPITQRQYELVKGSNPSTRKTDMVGNVAAQRPVENITWNVIRGGVAAGTSITANSEDSFLRRLVQKTGIPGFDLPTEAQWEIACRAGSTAPYGSYWNGSSAVKLTSSNIGEAAWYYDNTMATTYAVGGRRPNLWGLYDMQGNVWEWCRDVFISTYNASCVDVPYTETVGENMVLRGGARGVKAENCRPSVRIGFASASGNESGGFRLSRTCP